MKLTLLFFAITSLSLFQNCSPNSSFSSQLEESVSPQSATAVQINSNLDASSSSPNTLLGNLASESTDKTLPNSANSKYSDYFIGNDSCVIPTRPLAFGYGLVNMQSCNIKLSWNDSPGGVPRKILRLEHPDFSRQTIDTTKAGSVEFNLDPNTPSVKIISVVGSGLNASINPSDSEKIFTKFVSSVCEPGASKTSSGDCVPNGHAEASRCSSSSNLFWAGTSTSTVAMDSSTKTLLCTGKIPEGLYGIGTKVSISALSGGTVDADWWFLGYGHAALECVYDNGIPKWKLNSSLCTEK